MSHISKPKIPPELIRPILEHVEDKTCLFSLTVTSKAFQSEAERLLYLSVTKCRDGARHALFLTSINTVQRLPPLVKEYEIYSVVDRERDAVLWGLLKSALNKMINLKVFKFRELSGQPSADMIFYAPFQLETLYWGNYYDEEPMRIILAEQKNLKALRLECSRGTTPYSLDACPNLTSLWGNRYSIGALLPGRKIIDLSWEPDAGDSFKSPVLGLEMELSQIKIMSFGGYFRRPSLKKIAHMLTSIEVFELVGCREEEKDLIKVLGTLRELVLSTLWGEKDLPFTVEQRKEMVKAYFSALPRLERIDIAFGEDMYQSWVRGSSKIQSRPMDEVLSRFKSDF